MNDKRKYYWLWAAIGLLLCLNIGTIGWIVRKADPARSDRTGAADAFLPKRLGFDKQQRLAYRQYRQELRQALRPKEDSLRQLRATLFTRLQEPTPPSDAGIDSLINRINDNTVQINRLRFRHWKQVRQLCTPAQLPAFNELMTRLADRLNRTNANTIRERRQRQIEKYKQ